MKNLSLATLVLVFVGFLLWRAGLPKTDERRSAVWQQPLAQAESARAKGDFYRAMDAYNLAAQMASSADDWQGLLAVARGLETLGRDEGPSLHGFEVLVRAMTAAERSKSRAGLRAVGGAFTTLGQSFAAFAVSRIQNDWPEDEKTISIAADCRKFARPASC